MCADCGKTFTDIAGIKSHICPLLNQQYQTMMNGSPGHMDFHNTKHQHFLGESGEDVGFEGHNASAAEAYFRQQTFHDNVHGEMSDSEAECEDDEEEDDGEMYQCSVCGNHYTSMRALRSHLRGHTQTHGAPSACGPSSLSSLEVKKDEPSENQQGDCSLIICSTCGESFTKKQDLQAHQLLHSNIESNPQEQFVTNHQNELKPKVEMEMGQMGDPRDPRPFVCDQCGRSYRHAGSLVNHKNSHKTGEYYCALCNNTYSNQLAMKNHLRIHFAVKRHCCQDCGKAFRGNKQGKVRGHKREKNLTCKQCRLVFPDTELLEGHTCKERPFKCNICSRSYRHAGSLLNHKNTHKTGHFTCTFCAKPFSNPMALRNHTRIHTQKKKYVCPTCGKAFRLSSILYNHQKIHTRGITHYSCQTCGKSFQGKSGLKRHRCYRNGNPNSTVNQDGVDKCYT
uniref:Zinc finger protein 646 n=1 Tax=Sinocyclocheilus grahami TaxID=75366 RepID=A0A672M668_SINGR